MKLIKKIQLFVVLCFVTVNLIGQVTNHTNNFIEVKIRPLLNDKFTKDYSISVYADGLRIDSMYNRSKRALYVNLECNKIYSLRCQKSNCADKIVIINTILPADIDILNDEIRYFEIEMSDVLLKNSEETIDLPVAILVFDKTEKLLVVCEEYHEFIHQAYDSPRNNVNQVVLTK